MKNNIKLNLYQNVITSEFFLTQSVNKSSLNSVSSKFKLAGVELNVLDLNILTKNLKQLLSVLNFIKEKNSYCLTIQVDSLNLYLLLRKYFSSYPLSLVLHINYKFYKQKNVRDSLRFILSINKNVAVNDEKLYKRGFLIVCHINNFLKRSFNSYKLHNDVFEIKKIVFLITLLDKILKK